MEVCCLPSRCLMLLALASPVWSQCFDLASTHLNQPQARFQEWWDKPIWNAKPGEGNFHVDNGGWGDVTQFAIFAMGQVRKTESGWVPLSKSRVPEHRCEILPKDAG